jgi:predicted negative regulator of RcsB-dependent stress response
VARARLTRSELKSQDEITTTIQNFGEQVVARKKQILTWGVIVVAVVLVFFGWRLYAASRTADAQRQLGAVIAAYKDTAMPDTERFEKTISEAQKTMSAHPSTAAASMAQYFLALGQNGLGDKPNAIKNLEEVIGRGDVATKPVAQFALAGIYKTNGEYQKAIDILKQLESSGDYAASVVAYEVGLVAEAAGQKDQAQTYYSKVITESPDSPFRPEAENALKRMGLPIPTPPAATPTPGTEPAAK